MPQGPLGRLGLLLRELLGDGLDALQYLNIMGDLVLILVHVAPQRDAHLALRGNRLLEDRPAMTIEDHII